MDHAPTCICTDKISIALKANLQIWSTNQRGSRNKGIKYDVSDVYSCVQLWSLYLLASYFKMKGWK